MRIKELFYYVIWGSNVTGDVHWCVTADYQQIASGNIANQIHGFTIDYGKFIPKRIITRSLRFLCITLPNFLAFDNGDMSSPKRHTVRLSDPYCLF